MISFFAENDFGLKDGPEIKRWVESVVLLEKFEPGEINFIFSNDDYLLEINQRYLGHDTLTDIITFNYNEEREINADIYISTERVAENAEKFDVSLTDELHRVIVHGVLHLCGYNDKTDEQIKQMRQKEDYYLSLRDFL